jgi:hypothetical protein
MTSASNKPNVNGILIFSITDNMKKAGISEFLLNEEFIIKFNNGAMCSASFFPRTDSTSRIIKRINQAVKTRLNHEHLIAALLDIEAQIIERHKEVFSHNDKLTHKAITEEDEQKLHYHECVTNLKKEREQTKFTFQDWQNSVREKYENLRRLVEKNFPEAWSMLQFCLAVKSVLHIDGCTLPFMGVILAKPSSMKTLVVQLFRKYPRSFYSDNFTPNSFESHNASLSEEQLQKIDLLPKLRSKLFLTPELAPIFTTNEDELRKSLGIITRILDGHGLETDSGSQGHRKYGNTFFVWIGAAVEIPYRVWQLLGTLGHKNYFFRPIIPEKTINELEEIAKDNDFQDRFRETEEALLEYLIGVDAALASSNSRVDESGILKVKWNKNEQEEQARAIQCIAQIANLQKRLRGTVYVSQSKYRTQKSTRYVRGAISNESGDQDNDNETTIVTGDESDYDTDYPIVEDPSRAVVMLRNLAIGNALSQGRDYINIEDISLIVGVALSTTSKSRSEIIKLLLKQAGELTTSTIVKENRISAPFAKRTMRELAAVGIVYISSVAGYSNSELKIILKKEYSWFKGEQFKCLLNSNDSGSKDSTDNNRNSQNQIVEPAHEINNNFARSRQSGPDSCDEKESQSHAETKSTVEAHIKNFENSTNSKRDSLIANESNTPKHESTLGPDEESRINKSSERNDGLKFEHENNTPLWGAEPIQHVPVTESEEEIVGSDNSEMHNLALSEILEVIKEANGSQISFNAAIDAAWSRNELVRTYIGDKLTLRENKKVRNLAVEIVHHPNIEVVKTRPQIIIRWIESAADNNPRSAI